MLFFVVSLLVTYYADNFSLPKVLNIYNSYKQMRGVTTSMYIYIERNLNYIIQQKHSKTIFNYILLYYTLQLTQFFYV